MSVFEIVVAVALLFVSLEQAVAVGLFLAYCRRRRPAPPDEQLPEVLVVLPLRGCDGTLKDCLRALVQQDYPRYRVRVMVDSRSDPAWQVVQETVEELHTPHVEVRLLETRGTTCTLKCSALLQATADLDPGVAVVAFVDADVALTGDWLRKLVAPLAGERVEAAMGNRWYRPRQGQWGSLVRYVWGISAVVNMHYYNVPWGGSLAVKADLLRHSNLRELWSRAGCDDVPLYQVLRARRRALVFVPNLLLLAQDECRVWNSLRFIGRQFLWVRLYHPVCWWTCALFHVVTVGSQCGAPALAVAAAVCGRGEAAAWLAGASLVNALVTFGMVASLERYAARVTPPAPRRPVTYWLKTVVAFPLAEAVVGAGFLFALLARRVEWRGIWYRIRGPWNIRMVEYRPLIAAEGQEECREPVPPPG